MKRLLLVLDDWEGLIQKAAYWDDLKDRVQIKFLKDSIDKLDDSEIGQAEFLVALRERTVLNDELFSRMPELKLILQTGGHAYHVDFEAAKKRNIDIALGSQVRTPLNSVSELTFAFILGLTHKVYKGNRSMQNGEWQIITGRTLYNRRLGILGLGRHGSRVAQIANNAFNMEVVAWDRDLNTYEMNDGIKRVPLGELLETSDVVSIHLRLSKESIGLINKERLAMMKPGAILINTSRGAIVDEEALIEAIKEGALAGAGLDVFVQEPLPIDSPLRKLDNVILTPHIGWTVEEVFDEFAKIVCTQLKAYLNGKLSKSELLS